MLTILVEVVSFTNTTAILQHMTPATLYHHLQQMLLSCDNNVGTNAISVGNSHDHQLIQLLVSFVWMPNRLKYPSLDQASTLVITFPYLTNETNMPPYYMTVSTPPSPKILVQYAPLIAYLTRRNHGLLPSKPPLSTPTPTAPGNLPPQPRYKNGKITL